MNCDPVQSASTPTSVSPERNTTFALESSCSTWWTEYPAAGVMSLAVTVPPDRTAVKAPYADVQRLETGATDVVDAVVGAVPPPLLLS